MSLQNHSITSFLLKPFAEITEWMKETDSSYKCCTTSFPSKLYYHGKGMTNECECKRLILLRQPRKELGMGAPNIFLRRMWQGKKKEKEASDVAEGHFDQADRNHNGSSPSVHCFGKWSSEKCSWRYLCSLCNQCLLLLLFRGEHHDIIIDRLLLLLLPFSSKLTH